MATKYTVKAGDTVSGILKSQGYSNYGSSSLWNEVAQASGLSNPNLIRPGQELTLPDLPGATQPATPVTTTPAAVATPTTAQEVSPYLKQVQENQKQLLDMQNEAFADLNISDEERYAQIEAMVKPTSELPEAPKLLETFTKLQGEYGVDELTTELTSLQDDVYALENQLRDELGIEEGKVVNLRKIGGRQTEAQRQAVLLLDSYNRSITRVTNQINSAQSTISTILQLTQTDYDNALNRYTTEMNTNMQIYSQMRGEKIEDRNYAMNLLTTSTDFATTLYEIEQKEIQRQQDLATSNLQIISNAIADGNISYSDLDANTKIQIAKMEAQAGLPQGFTSKLRSSEPQAEIISTTQREYNGVSYVDVITRDKVTGEIKTTTQTTGKVTVSSSGTSGSVSYSTQQKMLDSAISILKKVDEATNGVDKGDHKLSYDEMDEARTRIIATVGDEETGKALFNQAMNAENYELWEEPVEQPTIDQPGTSDKKWWQFWK